MQPRVLVVCLTADRPQFIERMLASYCSQSYTNKRLFVLDSGKAPADISQGGNVYAEYMPELRGKSIGELRNVANAYAAKECLDAEIIAHADVDDWSHPRRIEEQVALLQASGKQCVGYKDMLFYDTTPGQFCGAWLYRHPTKPLGTSLCYWRSAWEARPFPDLPKNSQSSGEDYMWLQGVDHMAVTSLLPITVKGEYYKEGDSIGGVQIKPEEPRMIASIHGQNTTRYSPAEMELQSDRTSWRRAAEWDAHCRKVMAP